MRKNKGITLIALVVTIIVLLILATISITLVMGNNGIITRAVQAKEFTEIGEEKDLIGMGISSIVQQKEYSDDIELAKLVSEEINNSGTNKTISHGNYVSFVNTKRDYLITDGQIEEVTQDSNVKDSTPGEFDGKGTLTNPYKIRSIEDLVKLSNDVNEGETYEGKSFELVSDLDFYSVGSYVLKSSLEEDGLMEQLTANTGFKAIGGDWQYQYNKVTKERIETTKSFDGIFDGKYHRIKNFYSNRKRTYVQEDIDENSYIRYYADEAQSLFGKPNGTIKNLKVDGHIIGAYITTGISDYNFGTIENCSFSGKIEGTNVVAGITGYNYGIIKNSYNESDFYQYERYGIGGIVNSNYPEGIIENCYNLGNIFVEAPQSNASILPKVAGIAIDNMGMIKKCYNKGELKQFGNRTYVGGIVAWNESTIEECYNEGNIIANGGYCPRIGGLIGTDYADVESIIKNCYNSGDITIIEPATYTKAGGIMGEVRSPKTTVINFYNTGTITGVGSGYLRIGAFVGECKNTVSVQNSYYLDSSCKVMYSLTAPTIIDSSVKTEQEMKSDEFLNLLNVDSVWEKDTNNKNKGFPILKNL